MRGRITGKVNGRPTFHSVAFPFLCLPAIDQDTTGKESFRPYCDSRELLAGLTHFGITSSRLWTWAIRSIAYR